MDPLQRWLVSSGNILCFSKKKKLKFIILVDISATHYCMLSVLSLLSLTGTLSCCWRCSSLKPMTTQIDMMGLNDAPYHGLKYSSYASNFIKIAFSRWSISYYDAKHMNWNVLWFTFNQKTEYFKLFNICCKFVKTKADSL